MSDVIPPKSTVDLHVAWQEAMGKALVPRTYVERALQQILSGEVTVDTYPGGAPTLRATYALASQLHKTDSTVH